MLFAVFPSPVEAREACRRLNGLGVDMSCVSVIGKGHHVEEQASGYFERDGPHYLGRHMSVWQELWKLLEGSAFLWVPDLGPLIIAGPLSDRVVAELQSRVVVGGISLLGASLMALGVPGNDAAKYETAVRADQLLLILQAPGVEIVRTFQVLKDAHPLELELHPARAVTSN